MKDWNRPRIYLIVHWIFSIPQIQRNTTPMYRSPEMIDLYSNYPVNEKADIWVWVRRQTGIGEPIVLVIWIVALLISTISWWAGFGTNKYWIVGNIWGRKLLSSLRCGSYSWKFLCKIGGRGIFWWHQSSGKVFLCKDHQFAKAFSSKSFPLYGVLYMPWHLNSTCT